MSLILDALRKSEAERRRGQSPSLYAAAPVPGTRARPTWLRWLPLVALAVLLVVALFTWLGEPGVATKDELEADASAAGAESIGAVDASADSDAAIATTAPAPAPSAPPASAAPAPTVDALVKPAVAPPAATAPAPAPTPTPTIAAAPTPAAPAEPAPLPADATTLEQLPPVAVLDAGTRSSLPAMKLSMHVYNADATRRFAIIDGQRVTEGSQVGAATVVEIRRDGVVLDVSGRRVLLPRP